VSLLSSRDKGFNSALKGASFQKNSALALNAFNPDISPEPDYLPFVAAAGVLLLEANYITQLYLHNHSLNHSPNQMPYHLYPIQLHFTALQ